MVRYQLIHGVCVYYILCNPFIVAIDFMIVINVYLNNCQNVIMNVYIEN